jgi:hypothetical protein
MLIFLTKRQLVAMLKAIVLIVSKTLLELRVMTRSQEI